MDDKIGTFRDTPAPRSMLAGPVIATVLYALARGVPMARITEATGLESVDLLRLDARLPERHMPALWRVLIEAFPGRSVGLEMAASVPFSFLGVLLLSTRHAGSLRQSLQLLSNFKAVLSSRVQVTLVCDEVESRLEFYHPLDEEDLGCASDFAAATGVRYFREVLGIQGALLRVELAHDPIGNAESYCEFFGVPVLFSAESNALIFRSEVLDRPLPRGDAWAFRLALAHLERVREHELARRIDPALAPIIEAILENAERGIYEVGALARRMAMTPRSLQRLVAAQGITLRSLLDKARESRALRLLGDPRRSIGEIAEALGYAGEASFRRAFRRWTGKSPTEARQQREARRHEEESSR